MSICKRTTRVFPAACAWTLLIGTTSLFFAFPCSYLIDEYHIAIPICQGILTFFVVINFTLATFVDPGVFPKASPEPDKGDGFREPLYKNIEINGVVVRMKWCVTCQFYRPPRCSHCSICDGCIETFDHHCPWVNNCIGRRNYRYFFFFLIFLCLHMITIFAFSVLYVLRHRDRLQDRDTVVAFVIVAINTLLFIPIFGLTGFHVVLLFRGRTTNEQVTGKFRGGFNPFSRGCTRNVCGTLFGPQYPRYKDYSKKRKKKKPMSTATPSVSAQMNPNQVKIYMDHTNSSRRLSSSYNKISQDTGDLSDMDIMLESFDRNQSQSLDCEPSPPIPRRGSKTNFFSPSENNTRTAYIIPQQNSKPWSPYNTAGPPTPRAPRASIGHIDTSGHHQSPDQQRPWPHSPPRSLTGPLTPGQSPPLPRRPSRRYQGYPPLPRGPIASTHGSPSRKFASESELLAARADRENGNYEQRANQTADNLAELAGEKRDRVWDGRRVATSQPRGSLSERDPNRPPRSRQSPQSHRLRTPPPAPESPGKPKRPVSIVKALEMAEGARLLQQQHSSRSSQSSLDQDERKSLYEMNYEISV